MTIPTVSNRVSRRHFLQVMGITLVTTQVAPAFARFDPAQQDLPLFGRALDVLPVFDAAGRRLQNLWPDSVVEIMDSTPQHYRLPIGFVDRTLVQPMTRIPTAGLNNLEVPVWAQVSGPVATVHQWAAVDAPLITRIGHGGVMQITDVLPDARSLAAPAWYRLTLDGEPAGWSQSSHWSPVDISVPPQNDRWLEVNTFTNRLTAYDGEHPILEAPVSTTPTLSTGIFAITGRTPASKWHELNEHVGTPWMLHFGPALRLSGVYWHNRFGSPMPGPAVQSTPLLAYWLYTWLGDRSTVVIR